MTIRVVVTTGSGPSKTVEFPDLPAAPEGYRFVPTGMAKPKYVALPDGRTLMLRMVVKAGAKP